MKNGYVLLNLSIILYCTYIWSLPWLAHVADYNDKSPECSAVISIVANSSKSCKAHFANSTAVTTCGCGQGFFGQSSCSPGSDYGFSISAYIAPAPATAIMTLLSAIPILGMWVHGTGSHGSGEQRTNKHAYKNIAILSRCLLIAFTVCYVLFLVNPVCTVPDVHMTCVTIFAISGVLHYLLAAWLQYKKEPSHKQKEYTIIVIVLCIVTSVSFVGVTYSVLSTNGDWIIDNYTMWMCECIALTSGMSIVPIMLKMKQTSNDDDEMTQNAYL